MDYANVHPIIGSLCSLPEGGVDVGMYVACTQELSIDEVLDLREIDDVSRSWRAAVHANMDVSREAQKAKQVRKARS